MMKRILALILCIIVCFGAVSCSYLTAETLEDPHAEEPVIDTAGLYEGPIVLPKGFSAGFGRETINPIPGTCLGGWSTAKNRKSEKILDDIKLTCTALSDGVSIFLFYSVDALYVKQPMMDKVADMMKKTYDLPASNIVMNATHSHSAPIIHYPNMSGMPEYMSRFYPALERITDHAIRDLEESEIYISRTNTVNLNYVRRYVSVDGSYVGGSNIKDNQDPTQVFHETQPDTEMQLIRFDRKTKKDIVLCNWQCHVTTTSGEYKTDVSADWVGTFRDAAEKELGILFSYHQGAAGNLVPGSKIKGEKDNGNHRTHGKELAEVVKEALKKETKVASGTFQAKRSAFVCTHSQAYRDKEKVGATDTIYLYTLSIGDVAFATNPCEMHDTNGMELKKGSPFKMTFMCAYSNGVVSYIPADHAFDNGGYEVNMCHFVRGTGELIVEELLGMLQELHAKK